MATFPTADLLRGANTQYGFAVEATPNAGLQTSDPLAWFAPLSDGIRPNIEKNDVGDLGLTGDGLPGFRFVGKKYTEGDIVTLFDVDNGGMLRRAAFGTVGTAGTGPYTHTFSLETANPATLAAVRVSENTAGTTYQDLYKQMLCSQYVMEAAPGGEVRETFSMVGNIDSTGATPATQTRAAVAPSSTLTLLGKQSAAMGWNSNTYELLNWRFVIERTGIGSDTQYVSTDEIAETYISGNTQAYFEVEMPMSDYALLTAAAGTTQSDASIVFTIGSDTVTITLENAEVTSYAEDIPDAGPKSQTLRFAATGGGSFGAKMVVVNSQANAVVTQNTAA